MKKIIIKDKFSIGGNLAKGKGSVRNKLCPCGSGIKFKKCHLNQYHDFLRYKGSNLLDNRQSNKADIIKIREVKSKPNSSIKKNVLKYIENRIENYAYYGDYKNLKKAYREYERLLWNFYPNKFLYKGKKIKPSWIVNTNIEPAKIVKLQTY